MREDDSVLLCVVTGMAHSGTTYQSKLLCADNDIMCGFECGLLMNSVSRFCDADPWYELMQRPTTHGHWGISEEGMKAICNAGSYEQAYRCMKQHAGEIGTEKIRGCFANAKYIIDKTPAYVMNLDSVMAKVAAPFIVMRKNARSQFKSYKKRGWGLFRFIQRYNICMNAINRAMALYPDRILIVDHDRLLSDKDGMMRRIYAFIGKRYDGDLTLDAYFERTGFTSTKFVGELGGMLPEFEGDATRLTWCEKAALWLLDVYRASVGKKRMGKNRGARGF